MRRTFLKTACAVAVSMAFALPAFGADFNFKFAHSQPATSVRHKSMELFKDKLEKAGNGRIKVEIFAGSTLGNEGEVMDMVKMGNVQGTRGGAFAKANKKFLIYTLPFLFENTDSVLKAMRSGMGVEIAKGAEGAGYYIPATGVAGGFRQFTNSKRPINTPEDAAGLKTAFDKAAKEAMEWSDVNWLASESGYLDTLKKNMTVNTITPENRVKFVAKVKPVWDFYVKDGTFTDAEIQALIKAGR